MTRLVGALLMRNEAAEDELAYLAGFFDGEGCISISRSQRRGGPQNLTLTLYITNHNATPLKLAQKIFGGSILTRLPKVAHRRRLVSYVLCLHGFRAGEFLSATLPWLTVKREQAEAAILFAETFSSAWKEEKRYARSRGFAPTAEALQLRRIAFRAFRCAINQQGGRGLTWAA
jgi:hypothetical protein